jgi:O-antigen ligase
MRDMTSLLEVTHQPSAKMVVPIGLLCLAALGGIMTTADTFGDQFVAAGILGALFVSAVLVNPMVGLIALLGTLLLGLPGFLAGTGRLTANNLLGLVLSGMVAIQLCMKRDFWFVRKPQIILMLLICAVFVASLVRSWHIYIPTMSLRKDFAENTMFLLFSRLAFLLMLVNFVKTRRHVILILFSLLAFTMVVIPSVLQSLSTEGDDLELSPERPGEFRAMSSISSWGKNPNRLAFMCNVSILLIWMFAQIWSAKIVRIVAMPLILMLAGLVLTTVSRSGMLSLGLVFPFLLLQKGVSKAFRVGVVAAAVFCALALFLLLPSRASERLLNLSLDQSERTEGWRSTQLRLETKEHAIEIIEQDPLLGVGPGNFRWLHRQLYPNSLASVKPPHDSYLWATTEGGILALLLYLLLFYFIWRDIRAAHKTFSDGNQLWHVTRFLTGYLLLFLFFSNFADFWLEPHLYLLAALSMLVKRFATERVHGEPGSPAPVA